MTISEYRTELEKLLEETRQEMTIEMGTPMTIERAVHVTHTARKEGMILEEMKEVDEMAVAFDLPHRFAELLLALDAVGA